MPVLAGLKQLIEHSLGQKLKLECTDSLIKNKYLWNRRKKTSIRKEQNVFIIHIMCTKDKIATS